MAVLSTVIGRGTNASKPGSPATGYVYYSTDKGLLERYSGSAWERIGGGAEGGLNYVFSTTTTDADPGAGIMRFNNATPASVTILYIDDSPFNGSVDLGAFYADLNAGDRLYIRQTDDPSKYILAKVVSVADGTGYWKVTVTIDSSGSLPTDATLLSISVLTKGSTASGTTPWWAHPNRTLWVRQYERAAAAVVDIGTAGTLLSGTTRIAGKTGTFGSITETAVMCNALGTATPSAGTSRGMRIDDFDVRPDHGMYAHGHLRFAVLNDQDLFFGLSGGIPQPNITTPLAIGFMYRDGTDTNWQAARCNGTSWSYTDTGVAASAANWVNMEIVVGLDSGTYTAWYFINGSEVAKITTGLPDRDDETIDCYLHSWFQSGGDTGTYDVCMLIDQITCAYNQNELGYAQSAS